MALLQNKKVVAKFLVSTAKKGVGEEFGSEKTPRGIHTIAEKIGAGAQIGGVFIDRTLTGEIVPIEGPGRTPIVTRILRLAGLEQKNKNTFDRLIYLHGTPVESQLGMPASGGCIRMRSGEIVELFERVSVGTEIEIFEESLEEAFLLISEAEQRLQVNLAMANSGQPKAIHALCVNRMYGKNGFSKNDQAAVHWCMEGERRNIPSSITLLGELNERGQGVPVNLTRARELYERAAKLGHAHALFKIGLMYLDGIGGTKDEGVALRYLELAAYQGHDEAQRKLPKS